VEESKGESEVSKYTNRMRLALRTLKNPTPIPVDIAQHDDRIELQVDPELVERLPMKKRLDFFAYLNSMRDIVESEGSPCSIKGIRI